MSAENNNREIQTGSRVLIWRDDEDPFSAFLTKVAAAALTCGFELISKKGFVDIVKPVADDAGEDVDPPHQVTWQWKPGNVRFSPAFPEEEISLKEFADRFSSLEWCERNPHHPIAHMRVFLEKLLEIRETIERHGPSIVIHRGRARAVVPMNTPAEEIEALFREFEDSQRKRKS